MMFTISCVKNNHLTRVEKYYSSGELSEIFYENENNKKQGKYYDFNKNGKISSIFELKNGIINGWVTQFNENGLLDQKIKVKNDKIVDTLFRFSPVTGKLIYKVIYGLKEDTLKTVEYYPNGRLKNETIYTPYNSPQI